EDLSRDRMDRNELALVACAKQALAGAIQLESVGSARGYVDPSLDASIKPGIEDDDHWRVRDVDEEQTLPGIEDRPACTSRHGDGPDHAARPDVDEGHAWRARDARISDIGAEQNPAIGVIRQSVWTNPRR